MPKSLVIVESPAKAKTIGKFLGSNYKVIASNGHCIDLPKSILGIDVEHDFEPKYITLRGKGDLLKKIREEAKLADKIYLATDPDREGEAISWHLAKYLKMDVNSKCRIAFHEITASAVKEAIKAARPINMELVDAQQARRVLDRLVGYILSPVLWEKVQKNLSAGRVQSVTTRIICDREQEILDFVPEEYWNITAKLREGKSKKPFEVKYFGEKGKKRELRNEKQANEVLDRVRKACSEREDAFCAVDVKNSEKRRHAAPPFTTSSMQQEASRKHGFNTARTMMVAQQLYEGIEIGSKGTMGLITYIRTDSVRVAKEAQDAARDFILEKYGKAYLPQKPNVYKGRATAQDAHEAIRPTDVHNTPESVKPFLKPEQFKLYKLVYDRFMASQMADERYATSTITFDCAGASFRANSVQTLFDGFTAVYTEGRDDVAEKEVTLPVITQGDCFNLEKVDGEQRFTQPPPRYTEATLIKTLEEKGIGRPSTYATTISTILKREYVEREKKQLVPTELGFIVTRLMKDNFKDIVNVEFTANMEETLDKIEEGNTNWREIVRAFYDPFVLDVQKAKDSVEKIKIPDEVSDVICEKCGANMVYKKGRFGKFLGCPNYPSCNNTKSIIEKIEVPCPQCGSAIIKLHTKNGRTFYGCERYPECKFRSWGRPTTEVCPVCGKPMEQKISANGAYTICTDPACKHILRNPKAKKEESHD